MATDRNSKAFVLAKHTVTAERKSSFTTGDERIAWRNRALTLHKQLIALVGSEEKALEIEQEASQLPQSDYIVAERQILINEESERNGGLFGGAGGVIGEGLTGEGAPSRIKKQTPEQEAESLVAVINEEFSFYESTGDETYRENMLRHNAELVALVGEDEAMRLRKVSAKSTGPQVKRGPTLDDYAAFFREKGGVPFNAGTAAKPLWIRRKFDDLPPEIQQEVQATYADVVARAGEKPHEDLEDFAQGARGPTPEQLSVLAAARQEKQRQRNEEAAEKARIAAERERIRQEFAAQQAAEQNRLKQAELDRRANEGQDRAERERAKEADRHANQLYQWERQGWSDERIYARDQQSAEDRAQRDIDREQAKQNAIQKAIDLANARRQRLAADTATQLAKTLARTEVRVSALPQPGGIGLLLLAIAFILFAIMPVNTAGNTRLQLIFLSLLPWSGLSLPDSASSAIPGNNDLRNEIINALPGAIFGGNGGSNLPGYPGNPTYGGNFGGPLSSAAPDYGVYLGNDLPYALQSH